MTSALVPFTFRGDSLDVVRLDGGDVGVPLRRLCDVMGLHVQAQTQRLSRLADAGARWACTCVIHVQVGGQGRDLVILPRASIPMWAATVDLFRVAEAIRPKLLAYQDEVARVLADHFLRGRPRWASRNHLEERERVQYFLIQSRETFERVKGTTMHAAFLVWCKERGFEPVGPIMFGRHIAQTGLYMRRLTHGRAVYVRRDALAERRV